MPKTPLKKDQVALTARGHSIARKTIYPEIFKTFGQNILYIKNVAGSELDKNFGIDVLIYTQNVFDKMRLLHTIQERFRQYDKWAIENHKDITFTEWNHLSNEPSEWYKIQAKWMVYGFLNGNKDTSDDFVNWCIVSIPLLQLRYARREIVPSRDHFNDRDQSFLGFSYTDLFSQGCIFLSKGLSF
jgi:hypothetical protein